MVYPIVAFVAVVLVIWALAHVLYGKSTAQRRLDQLSTSAAPSPVAQSQGPADQLPTVTRFLSSRSFTEKMMLEMSRAGLKMRPSEFVVIVGVFVVVLAVVGFIFKLPVVSSVDAQGFTVLVIPIVSAIVGGVIGLIIPIAYLKYRQQKRLTVFNEQIADALSLMGSSLRSGYSFMRAMQVVSNEMPAPISEEFIRVIDECNVGVPVEDALEHLVERMRSYDLELVVTAVTIQIQLGGNLAEILDTIAETIRERVRINGEVSSLTAEGRLSGIILVGLPIVLAGAIYLLNPRYMEPLWMEFTGRVLVVGAVALILVGSYVMKRMLEIDF